MTIFWVDGQGSLIKATSDDAEPIVGATPITIAPESGKQIFDSVSQTWSLPIAQLKTSKIAVIDAKTQELISQGFTYDSQEFSLELRDIAVWTNLMVSRTNLTYPFTVMTKNNQAYVFATSVDVEQFYQGGFDAAQAHYDSDRGLKLQVNAATTSAEIDAIADTR